MTQAPDRTTNPIFGDQPFKIGLFAYLHQGAMTLTKAPERWAAKWDDIAQMARMADEGGLDYLIPISSWKGWRGEVDHRRWSYETLTHAAALSGITKRIGLFSTVHAPLVHPVFAAKAMATIDHASHGRAGLNIVCGWNKADFDMFGVEQLEHDERYDHGLEWYEIFSRLVREGDKDFDYDGKYYRDLKAISGEPGTLQQPQPAIVSAAFSPKGRDFAIRTSDLILTVAADLNNAAGEVEDIRRREAEVGRTSPIAMIANVSITCRETRAEAEEFDHYLAEEQQDRIAVDQWLVAQASGSSFPDVSDQRRRMAAAGGSMVVGTPADVVEVLVNLKKAGFAGAAIMSANHLADLPILLEKVLPLMEKAGLRHPATEAVS